MQKQQPPHIDIGTLTIVCGFERRWALRRRLWLRTTPRVARRCWCRARSTLSCVAGHFTLQSSTQWPLMAERGYKEHAVQVTAECRGIDDHFELSDEYALKMRLRFAWPDIIQRTV